MNNKGADQTARMRRLMCAFVVRIWHKQVFSWRGSTVVVIYFGRAVSALYYCCCCCVGVLRPFETFRSFRARSVNLSTLFLGKPPRQFTSTSSAHSFDSNWQLPFLNQRKGENGRRNYFMTNLHERMLPDVRIEPTTVRIPGGRASDRVTARGKELCCERRLSCNGRRLGHVSWLRVRGDSKYDMRATMHGDRRKLLLLLPIPGLSGVLFRYNIHHEGQQRTWLTWLSARPSEAVRPVRPEPDQIFGRIYKNRNKKMKQKWKIKKKTNKHTHTHTYAHTNTHTHTHTHTNLVSFDMVMKSNLRYI